MTEPLLNANQVEAMAVLEEAAENLSMAARARVYRGLADFLPDNSSHRPRLIGKSEILEEADRRCHELNFDVRKPQPTGGNGK